MTKFHYYLPQDNSCTWSNIEAPRLIEQTSQCLLNFSKFYNNIYCIITSVIYIYVDTKKFLDSRS